MQGWEKLKVEIWEKWKGVGKVTGEQEVGVEQSSLGAELVPQILEKGAVELVDAEVTAGWKMGLGCSLKNLYVGLRESESKGHLGKGQVVKKNPK